ncbi:MAG: 7-cyano-7-deazaguanine synthase QueC [Candidatus Omnitrophica bacterium]|nr:7-cyano-7-deazaguanine synthase QueC [Candidatus Omnitrophota bacterium]
MKKAVILLSGGLDSATIIYVAKSKGYKPYCLIFDYGQRHRKEINQAKRIAEHTKSKYYLVKIDLPWGGSSLLDKTKNIPKNRSIDHKDIPSTYVPARNIIFLSFAASYAEALGAEAVFIGANAVDYSGYPDCRPEFFDSYQAALKKGMKQGVEGNSVKIFTPLLNKTKAQIIKMGVKLKVPYHMTWSCYVGASRPCGECDSCILRQKGFDSAGVVDPVIKI